jgi:polar amino acid transport system substrate-binding protein
MLPVNADTYDKPEIDVSPGSMHPAICKLRYRAIDYPPNWFRDEASGKWTGFLVEMVEDIAKEMGVEAVPLETTWASCVLDLQSNKTDLQFGLQATPKRALVIGFAAPETVG